MKRLVLLGLTAITAALAPTLTGGQPAAVAQTTMRLTAFTHNVHGTRGVPEGSNALDSQVDYTISRIVAHNGGQGSHSVMLQEICRHQAEHVQAQLSQLLEGNYSLHFVQLYGRTQCADDSYGQAVLVKGQMNPHTYDLPDGPYDGEKDFKAACANFTYGGVAATACSVKLPSDRKDPDDARSARISGANGLVSYLAPRADSRVVVVGGDFNAKPHNAELNPFYKNAVQPFTGNGYYNEADQWDTDFYDTAPSNKCPTTTKACRSGESTHPTATTPPGERKYDYLFFDDNGAFSVVGNASGNAQNLADGVTVAGPSDHAILTGAATIAVP